MVANAWAGSGKSYTAPQRANGNGLGANRAFPKEIQQNQTQVGGKRPHRNADVRRLQGAGSTSKAVPMIILTQPEMGHLMSDTQNLPAHLTHYTTLDVLPKILELGFRASNVLYLNDGSELKFIIDIAKTILKEFVKNPRSIHYGYGGDIEAGLADERLPSIFATSFCTDANLLSQWRGYGGSRQGISITFHSEQLVKIFESSNGSPTKISYDESVAKAKLYNLLDVNLTDWDDVFGKPTLSPAEIAASVVLEQAPRHKHEGFKEEDEWRFFIKRENQQTDDVEFFARGGMLVPFLPIRSKKLPISRVTIGPGPHQLLNKQSIEILLRQKQYTHVEVLVSDIPYRT
ncbi:DUF2971 domain-containing protein [Rhizobium skierniewicense]|uniref:DUF2971 domain-containing protein n=1 Tax=Rhizobium skierniewicense TaxID=984260 RepID=UPI001FACAB0E|nr:DUF2971 domain-containing protein [Rhizobium skierniewicense]MCI9865527.1 DUF2971 domain-containing protein [Rhizobium skierniewicense]